MSFRIEILFHIRKILHNIRRYFKFVSNEAQFSQRQNFKMFKLRFILYNCIPLTTDERMILRFFCFVLLFTLIVFGCSLSFNE